VKGQTRLCTLLIPEADCPVAQGSGLRSGQEICPGRATSLRNSHARPQTHAWSIQWTADPAFDEILAAQRQIDWGKWR
jgi:hypothetical protein